MKELNTSDWSQVHLELNDRGFSRLQSLFSPEECAELAQLFQQPIYRSVINMQRYRFGQGEYKYFSYPLPASIQKLREEFYPHLAVIANEWSKMLGIETEYPSQHSEFIKICHQHGQQRPTPLILHYQKGGYNTLHQDLYGEIYFPFQVVIVLSQQNHDFEGGEFVITEQLPRAQSRAHVITPRQGDAVIFTTNFRPAKGTRGYYRAKMKHGISEIKSGERFALCIIFHDAT